MVVVQRRLNREAPEDKSSSKEADHKYEFAL